MRRFRVVVRLTRSIISVAGEVEETMAVEGEEWQR